MTNSNIDPREIAKDKKDKLFEGLQYAQERQNYSVDWLSRLGTEIATIFFTFTSIFSKDFLDSASIWEIRSFALGLIFLFFSIIFGLVQIRYKADFWSDIADIFQAGYKKWEEAWEEKIQNNDAENYWNGLTQERHKNSAPSWAWKLQTTLIMIGMGLIMVSFVAKIWK